MKHFRQMEQPEIVETLQRVTGVSLEDPRLSTLYDLLVTKGDHLQAERFISNALTSKSDMVRSHQFPLVTRVRFTAVTLIHC